MIYSLYFVSVSKKIMGSQRVQTTKAAGKGGLLFLASPFPVFILPQLLTANHKHTVRNGNISKIIYFKPGFFQPHSSQRKRGQSPVAG